MKMKILCLGLILLSSSLLNADEKPAQTLSKTEQLTNGYKEIHTQELKDLLKKNSDVVLVDVRNLDDGTRIQEAILVPYDTKDEIILAKIPNKEVTIVVYCVSKECPASKFMAKRLIKMGYKNVYKYPEGIEGWESSGNPTQKVHGEE